MTLSQNRAQRKVYPQSRRGPVPKTLEEGAQRGEGAGSMRPGCWGELHDTGRLVAPEPACDDNLPVLLGSCKEGRTLPDHSSPHGVSGPAVLA